MTASAIRVNPKNRIKRMEEIVGWMQKYLNK